MRLFALSALLLLSVAPAQATDSFRVLCHNVSADLAGIYTDQFSKVMAIEMDMNSNEDGLVTTKLLGSHGEILDSGTTTVEKWSRYLNEAPLTQSTHILGFFLAGMPSTGFEVVYRWDYHEADTQRLKLRDCRAF